MRVAINGMGRIGRLLARRLLKLEGIELVAVNDIMDPDNLVYLLRYDSVYGSLPEVVASENPGPGNSKHAGQGPAGAYGYERRLTIGNHSFAVYRRDNPVDLPWSALGVDIVLECSGRFTSTEAAGIHLTAGARGVLLSTTGSPDTPLLIYGFNHDTLEAGSAVVSPGGCMTNCSTPVLSLLDEIGIESAQVNILHSYTSRQELVDAPHRQFRRGRAAAESIIPVEIDLAVSLERLLPALHGRIATVSTRVPVANGAMADFTAQMKTPVSVPEINQLFRNAAEHRYKGILEYNEEGIVSMDIKGNSHSCVVDGTLTSVTGPPAAGKPGTGHLLKVIAWFDNEYGYTSRMIDWLFYWKRLNHSL